MTLREYIEKHSINYQYCKNDPDLVDLIHSEIICTGGDTTWQFIGEYGDRLRDEITNILTELRR